MSFKIKYHYLNTNSIVCLASPTLQVFFNKYAPDDVQFIPCTIITKDNKKVTDYAMMNILIDIDGYDEKFTEREYYDKKYEMLGGNMSGYKKLKFLDDAMGEHLIGRDKDWSIVLFSEKFRILLKEEKIKLKDYKYYPPEEWYA